MTERITNIKISGKSEDEIAYHVERNKIRNVMRKHDLVMIGSRLVQRDRLGEIEVPARSPVYTWETLPLQPDE